MFIAVHNHRREPTDLLGNDPVEINEGSGHPGKFMSLR